jgi:hypothetical protein
MILVAASWIGNSIHVMKWAWFFPILIPLAIDYIRVQVESMSKKFYKFEIGFFLIRPILALKRFIQI